MASPPAPPAPSTSYRPWEDTPPAAPPVSFPNGRPTERLPSLSSSALSPHNPRKRRRLSNERIDQQYHTSGLSSLGSPSEARSADFRGGERGGGCGGGTIYRRGDAVGDVVLSSAYINPNHNSNHFTQPQLPPPLHKPQPLHQTPPSSSISPRFPGSRPATPPQQQHRNHQSPSNQAPAALINIVSSIHNLAIDLAAGSSTSSSSSTPSPIASHQLPSIEALATCLETIYSLLKRLKLSLAQQHQAQSNGNLITHEQQAISANLSKLQQTLSTQQIAYNTLEKEYNSVLSKLSHSQAQRSLADRKYSACAEESENLANERERLMGVVEGLEETLAEVRTERDEMRLEMRKSGVQWGTIVQNAGKLEKGACKVEKTLRKEIEGLKNDVERLRTAVTDGGGCCAAVGEAGERERIDLKNRVSELERRLEGMKKEGKGIYELAELISKMGKGMAESR